MVNIEEIKIGDVYKKSVISIDGEPAINSRIRARMGSGKMVVSGVDAPLANRLAQESFNELGKHFSEVSFAAPAGLSDMFPEVTIAHENGDGGKCELIVLSLRPALSRWTKPWSFVQYIGAFNSEVLSKDNARFSVIDFTRDGLRTPAFNAVVFREFDKEIPLNETFIDLIEFICSVHEATERQLTANLNKGSLVTFFDFPPMVKVACEQYLQYFIQFLDDLGIEADSEISSDAGKVLFSVTPRSGEEALDMIQKALSAYLDLPRSDVGGYDVMGGDIALNQLRANISHLQGQLALAQGMIQLGQATVQAKNEMISAQAMQLSMFQRDQQVMRIEHSTQVVRQEVEPLFGSSVKVTTLKLKGLEVDLPGILRALKRRFPGNKD
jgi:hypothetical protein